MKVIMLSLLLVFVPVTVFALDDNPARVEIKRVRGGGLDYTVRSVCFKGQEYLLVNNSLAKTGDTCVIKDDNEEEGDK